MAQYNFAVGLRSGGTSGITLKKNYEYSALEGIVGIWNNGLSITALWERTAMAFNQPAFRWYYGIGAHISMYSEEFNGKGGISLYRHPHRSDTGDLGLGVDAIVGLEYKVPEIPIAFSLDAKPYVELITDDKFIFFLDPGFGIKLAF